MSVNVASTAMNGIDNAKNAFKNMLKDKLINQFYLWKIKSMIHQLLFANIKDFFGVKMVNL